MLQVYIDISETYHNKLQTGIQRVVRNTARELLIMARDADFDAYLYVSHPAVEKRFVTKDIGILDTSSEQGEGTPQGFEPLIKFGAKWYEKISQGPLSPLVRSKTFVSTARWLVNKLRRTRWSGDSDLGQPGRPDYFLLLDSFWSRGGLIGSELREIRESGGKVGLLIYDVIPLTHPEFVEDMLAIGFKNALNDVIDWADEFFFISEASKDEFNQIYGEATQGAVKKVIPLGVDSKMVNVKVDEVMPEARNHKLKILMIGTVEPRKNYGIVFDWWMQFGVGEFELTIIGKPGWKSERIQELMRMESEKNNGFTWIGKASDEELLVQIKGADIGVSASFVEGYGLPVAELWQAGLKVVASDTPVYREIAPPGVIFFNSNSVVSFDRAIRESVSLERKKPSIIQRTWQETAKSLVEQMQIGF